MAFVQENMILQLTNQLQIEGEEKRKLHVVIEEQERWKFLHDYIIFFSVIMVQTIMLHCIFIAYMISLR